MIVKNYKIIIIPNDSLNPAHPIKVAQAKPQLKDQMQVAIPFRLAYICRSQMHMPYVKYYKKQQHIYVPYMRHYKRLCNYQAADITLICSVNCDLGLLSSFL